MLELSHINKIDLCGYKSLKMLIREQYLIQGNAQNFVDLNMLLLICKALCKNV